MRLPNKPDFERMLILCAMASSTYLSHNIDKVINKSN